MPRVGQSRKRDANERPIIKALEAVGAKVTQISQKGAPDLLVKFRGIWIPLEVKSAKGTLTEAQTFGDFIIVRSIDEALKAIGATR